MKAKLQIMKQMNYFLKKKVICKIISDKMKNNNKIYGTGFFVRFK